MSDENIFRESDVDEPCQFIQRGTRKRYKRVESLKLVQVYIQMIVITSMLTVTGLSSHMILCVWSITWCVGGKIRFNQNKNKTVPTSPGPNERTANTIYAQGVAFQRPLVGIDSYDSVAGFAIAETPLSWYRSPCVTA